MGRIFHPIPQGAMAENRATNSHQRPNPAGLVDYLESRLEVGIGRVQISDRDGKNHMWFGRIWRAGEHIRGWWRRGQRFRALPSHIESVAQLCWARGQVFGRFLCSVNGRRHAPSPLSDGPSNWRASRLHVAARLSGGLNFSRIMINGIARFGQNRFVKDTSIIDRF